MKIIFWNIGEYGKNPCSLIRTKFLLLRKLLRNQKPDIFCVIEGTKSKIQNKLIKKMFSREGYQCYYSPSLPKSEKYKNYFEFTDFEPFGLKIFFRKSLDKDIKPLKPATVLFNGRLIKVVIKNNILIFLHRNRSANNYEKTEFIKQIMNWIVFEPDSVSKDFYVLGDFNLTPWDEEFFSENTGFLPSSTIKQVHFIRSRSNLGLSFYNPIIEIINSKNEPNLGGTYFKNDKKYKWQVLDYVLIEGTNLDKSNIDVITKINSSTPLIDSSSDAKTFINYSFDHLPIKLEIK